MIAVSKTSHAIVWSTATTCPAPGGKGLQRIRDVAVGSDGNIYAVDTDNNRVVEFAASNGACVGSGWSGTTGHILHQPRALTSDGSGGLWIAEDGGSPALVHFNNAGTTFLGSTSNGGVGGFVEPEGVFLNGTNVVVADPFAFRTISFTAAQANGNLAGTAFFKGGPALGGFNNPFGVAYAPTAIASSATCSTSASRSSPPAPARRSRPATSGAAWQHAEPARNRSAQMDRQSFSQQRERSRLDLFQRPRHSHSSRRSR